MLPSSLVRVAATVISVVAVASVAILTAWFLLSESEDSQFDLGAIDAFEVGSVTTVEQGKFHLARLSQEEFVALSWVDPHLGCSVRWRADFVWPTSGNGEQKNGWFRNGCHGETYDIAGLLVFGPSPRDLDLFVVSIEDGRVVVDTSTYVCDRSPPGAPCATLSRRPPS